LTCEVISIAFLVLGLSAKVSTFLRIRSFSALLLSFLDAPGAVLVHVVPVAGGAHGGQGVLVARDALAAKFAVGVLTILLHWSSALFASILAPATVAPGEVKPAGSISNWSRLPVDLLGFSVLQECFFVLLR